MIRKAKAVWRGTGRRPCGVRCGLAFARRGKLLASLTIAAAATPYREVSHGTLHR
jgi:hypothetical protein